MVDFDIGLLVSSGITYYFGYVFFRGRADGGGISRRFVGGPSSRHFGELVVTREQDLGAGRPAVAAVGQYCLDVSHYMMAFYKLGETV